MNIANNYISLATTIINLAFASLLDTSLRHVPSHCQAPSNSEEAPAT
jgi:hypothetical protein